MRIILVLGVFSMLLSAAGCGLDGLTGRLLRIDGSSYLIETRDGKERWIHVDNRTRKDTVEPGEEVHVYVTKDGHAEFVQRLD
jgi:hypothetical protein